MQLSLKKQALFLFFLTSFSISPFSLKANTPESQEDLQTVLESSQQCVLSSLIHLERIVQDIILEINSGMNVAQSTATREALFNCRQLITNYHQQTLGMTVIDAQKIVHIIAFIEQMTSCLLASIKSNFKKLPLFEISQVRSKIPLDDITIKELQSAVHANEKQINHLKTKATNLRLNLLNRFFRSSFKAWSSISPFIKYPTIIALTTSYLLCQFTHWDLPWLRNITIPYFKLPLFGHNKWSHQRILENFEQGNNVDLLKSLGLDPSRMTLAQAERKLHELMPLGASSIMSTAVQEWRQDPVAQYTVNALGTFAFLSTFWQEGKKMIHEKSTKLMNSLKGLHGLEVKSDQYELTSDTTFEDVIGYEEVKQQLLLHIIRFLQDPERFTRFGLVPEKGWLFTGPSRTGKSYMIKALYGEVFNLMKSMGKEKDFVFKQFHSSIIIKYGIKLIAQMLKEQSPCTIIFIDEIDLLNLQRVGNSTLLADFLTTMSGFMEDNPERQVFIIGATNKPETLDKSLRQHGRFGKEIRFDKPSLINRRTYLLKRFTELALDTTTINIDLLAYYTDGCVFEELESMIREAIHQAKVKGKLLTQELFEEALNSAVHNIVTDKPVTLAPQEHLVIAVHQIGIALAHILLGSRDHISLVTTRPIVAKLQEETHYHELYRSSIGDEPKQKETIYGKVFTFKAQDSVGIESMEDKIIMCKTLLAGYIAEEIMFGASSYSYQPANKFNAFKIAQEIASKGIALDQLSDELKAKITQTAWNMLEDYEKELKKLFQEHKPYLTLLSSWVMEQNLSGKQISDVLSAKKSEIEEFLNKAKEQAEQELKAAQEAVKNA